MIEYPQYRALPADYIKIKFAEFIAEDAPTGDLTAEATIDDKELVNAYIASKSELVFAGEQIIKMIFANQFNLRVHVQDGAKLKPGIRIAEFRGNARDVLLYERVTLNLIQRLSGIASLTSKYVELAKPYDVKILDTRKTTPGLRLFEKYAVTCGGGYNHRLNLSEGILIKDNHIQAAGSVSQAMISAKTNNQGKPVEIEVDTIEQIHEAMKIVPDGFLLDNMNRESTLEAVRIIRSHSGGKEIFIESSGGINLSNITDYLDTGINAISIGALTHSAVAVDIHMEFE